MPPTSPDRLSQQIAFILELDRLKSIARRTLLIDQSRRENSAEHSWHIALMAPLLAQYAPSGVDPNRVTRMLLVHDVIEIHAGDTYCYDPAANSDKPARERAAADQLFSLLPSDQCAAFRALWDEFEAAATPDSQFANAMDRLQPLLNNYHTQGAAWRDYNITPAQVRHRMSPIALASPALAAYAESLITDAIAKGYLPRD